MLSCATQLSSGFQSPLEVGVRNACGRLRSPAGSKSGTSWGGANPTMSNRTMCDQLRSLSACRIVQVKLVALACDTQHSLAGTSLIAPTGDPHSSPARTRELYASIRSEGHQPPAQHHAREMLENKGRSLPKNETLLLLSHFTQFNCSSARLLQGAKLFTHTAPPPDSPLTHPPLAPGVESNFGSPMIPYVSASPRSTHKCLLVELSLASAQDSLVKTKFRASSMVTFQHVTTACEVEGFPDFDEFGLQC